MADVFSGIENVYDIPAVSDFCNSRLQQLPFNSQYAKQAANQLVDLYSKLNMSELSDSCSDVCMELIKTLTEIMTFETIEFETLVISYETLRTAIVLVVLLNSIYNCDKDNVSLVEYKTCLEYIDTGKLPLAIDLGESAIAHSA